MSKEAIGTLREKNRIIANILGAMVTRNRFLLVGHRNPDDDSIASLVAFALLLNKLSKPATIYLGNGTIHEQYDFLLKICRYNAIDVIHDSAQVPADTDTVVICDTPKPDRLEADERIFALLRSPDVVGIEIDHHLGGDSEYIGDREYSFVMEASSASELVGHLTLRMGNRKDILDRFQIADLFSRNLSLAILTGLVGESGMGRFLTTRREQRYYRIFSTIFNTLLQRKTTRPGNLSRIDEIYRELHRLSAKEETCYASIAQLKRFSECVGYIVLDGERMERLYGEYDEETITSVSRAVANSLAEESGKLSLIVMANAKRSTEPIRFRMRRSAGFKSFDLRDVLTLFAIEDGGGHEGAIAFRIPSSRISDLSGYVDDLIRGIEDALRASGPPADLEP